MVVSGEGGAYSYSGTRMCKHMSTSVCVSGG
jgi:hypothetical protein